MLGVIASQDSNRIFAIYGLVITNSQSVFAYSYIFKTFISIVGKAPSVIITDEEKTIYYAL